jgi:type IV pilus assembly protein PilX
MVTNQKGLALATAMVFLIILSVVGVSSMRSAVLEQNMSSNMQDLNHAFQLAETAIARTTENSSVLNTTSTQANPVTFHYTSVYSALLSSGDLIDASSHYRGEGIPKGETAEEINSIDTTSLHIFHIETVGKYNNARSTHGQGLTIVGPKTN